jgi:hypothetical protein
LVVAVIAGRIKKVAHFQLWTHGASVQIQHPERAEVVQRAGWGAIVQQAEDSWNWFHFAIPTLKEQEDTFLQTVEVFLRVQGRRGNIEGVHARIEKLHVWDGGRRLLQNDKAENVDWGRINAWQVPPHPVEHGVGISVYVHWRRREPIGAFSMIEFLAAGARFEEI